MGATESTGGKYVESITFAEEPEWVHNLDDTARAGRVKRAAVLRECIRRALPGVLSDIEVGRFDDRGPEGRTWQAK